MTIPYLTFDVESFPNFFAVCFCDVRTKKRYTFEISDRVDQLPKLINFYNKLKRSGAFIIGFNIQEYDIPMMEYITKHRCSYYEIYLLSKTIVEKEFDAYKKADLGYLDSLRKPYSVNPDRLKEMKNYHTMFTYHLPKRLQIGCTFVDLARFWSMSKRFEGAISLKSLGVQLGYPVLKELPYDPDHKLTNIEKDEVLEYLEVHDINLTNLLLTKLSEDFKLRSYIHKEYNLKCYSSDAVTIGLDLLKLFYKKKFDAPLKLKETHAEISFKDVLLDDLLPLFPDRKGIQYPNKRFFYSNGRDLLKDLYTYTHIVGEDFNQRTILLPQTNTGFTLESHIGLGGIHGTSFKGVFVPEKDHILLDIDADSYYPSLIEEQNLLRDATKIYSDIKTDRISAKRSGDKMKSNLFKLILNAISGNLKNMNPFNFLQITINGQIILQLLTERLMNIGADVLYQNTDGITAYFHKSLKKQVWEECKMIEDTFTHIKWSYDKFVKFVVRDVNNFLAVTDSGEVKTKGIFSHKKDLGSSSNFLIIPEALVAYYVHGTPFYMTIYNCQDIIKFMASYKVNRDFYTTYRDKKLQRRNRIYPSKTGSYIMKVRKRTGQTHHILKDSPVQLANNLPEEKPKDLNYKYFLRQCINVRRELSPPQLTLGL